MVKERDKVQLSATCRRRSAFMCLLVSLALVSCTNTLIVEGEFPEPLVNKLPINAGLHISPEFRDYAYQETSDDREKWVILLGEIQADLFSTLLPGMFANHMLVTESPPWDELPTTDLVIIPSVDEFQYALPSETHVQVFEVWLKYRIQVFEPDGETIADWIVTGYGKTPEGFFRSNEVALNQAIIVALRDAGANMALNFSRVPEISAWLDKESP